MATQGAALPARASENDFEQRADAGSMERAFELLHQQDAGSREQAYALLRWRILRWGIRFCGGRRRADAEDHTQDVVISSLPHLGRLPDPQALSAYLYQAVRNRYYDSFRRSGLRRASDRERLPGRSAPDPRFMADPAESPEARALRLEQRDMVYRAMLTLPSRYRIVLLLHDVEDLDTSTVAKVLALDPATVRVQLHRARMFIRRQVNAMLFPLRGDTEPGARARRRCERIRGAGEGRGISETGGTFASLLERTLEGCGSLAPEMRNRMEAILRRELRRERRRLIGDQTRGPEAGIFAGTETRGEPGGACRGIED